MDLSTLSTGELQTLLADVSALIAKRQKRDREAAIEQIYAVAHGLNLPLNAILNGPEPVQAKTRRKGRLYQDPRNPANTWGGRGPRPAWLTSALAAGVTLESLLA